jgi:hypothetical protein
MRRCAGGKDSINWRSCDSNTDCPHDSVFLRSL